MSDVTYPIGLLKQVRQTPFNLVAKDAFEAGNAASSLRWGAQYFKSSFRIQHAPLSAEEFRYLLSFYSQRSGVHDYFWYRDNLDRTGNYKVRFAQPITAERYQNLRNVEVMLEEVAPRRMLPFLEEVNAAVIGVTTQAAAWYSGNRQIQLTHLGSALSQEVPLYDIAGNYPLYLNGQLGAVIPNLSPITSQWTSWNGYGSTASWMQSAGNVTELAGGAGAATIFMVFKSDNTGAKLFFYVGTDSGAQKVYGIGQTAANKIALYTGNGAFQGASSLITNDGNWHSVAFVVGGGNVVSYLDANVVGTDAITVSYAAGKATMFGTTGNTLTPFGASIQEVLLFPATLGFTQVKNLHNLFVPQQGLVTVP